MRYSNPSSRMVSEKTEWEARRLPSSTGGHVGSSDEAPLYLPTRMQSVEAGGESELPALLNSNGVPFSAHMGGQRMTTEEPGLLPQAGKAFKDIMSENFPNWQKT